MLEIGNGKVAIDTLTGFITLPSGFCHFTELIQHIFPDIAQFNNHNLLSELAIFAAKNKDVDYLNATIRNCLPGELFSFKSVTIINQDDVATIPQNFRIQWICLGSHLTFTIKSRISRNHAA